MSGRTTQRLAAPRHVVTWGLSLAALIAVTAGMLWLRGTLDKAHVALVYLLVVLLGSAAGGRVVGLGLAGLAFLAFNVLFLPPYGTLVIANPLDWLVLGAFLVTSVVATQLLTRAQQQAEEARGRTVEVERLSALGAESLNAVRAEDALRAITDVVRSTLDIDRCDIYVRWNGDAEPALAASSPSTLPEELAVDERRHAGESLLVWASTHGVVAERTDGTLHVPPSTEDGSDREAATDVRAPHWWTYEGVRVLFVPLRVRGHTVGVLRLLRNDGLRLVPQQQRFLDALTYYASLGVERARLTADAEHVEAMREADRLKNALLATVSHDLRTPLTTVKALAHEVAEGGASPNDPRVRSIEEEADRLTAFVADLLDLSRLTGNALRLDLAVNTADDLIGAAAARATGVLATHPLETAWSPDTPVLLGYFDFVHALRALVNLIENAAKYSAQGTPIELSAKHDGETIIFTVADRGMGVPEGERERIFEPFYRPSGLPPDVRGAGLGLAIAQGLAVAQGGTVQYEPRPGGGSLFHLVLPAHG